MSSNKFSKHAQMEVAASLNLNQANPQPKTEMSGAKSTEQGANLSFQPRGGRTGVRGNNRGRGRGRFGNIQCQVCFKYGHLAVNCYHWFNQQF